MTKIVDVVIIGAGASGMMCAAQVGQKGLSVVLVDHAKKIGEKIRVSGGGRCNFTNRKLNGLDAAPYYVSEQSRFVRHALSNYTATDFIKLIERHKIEYHERDHEQLFCDHCAQEIIELLQKECALGDVAWQTECTVQSIEAVQNQRFHITTNQGDLISRYLVVATGGLALPAVGATGFGYEIAKQFGHSITPLEAALVPLQFETWIKAGFDRLSGLALPVIISTRVGKNTITFEEDLLFRHKGLSGPAILQISNYWHAGQNIEINLCPERDLATSLCTQKSGQKIQLDTALFQLAPKLSKRLLQHWIAQESFVPYAQHKWADVPNKILIALGQSLNQWRVHPSGHDGHKKAEATRGGVSTRELDPKTMESKLQSGLYFIGEVIDITGWLGGYNFQWAWSSAVCAAKNMAVK